jgi:hypothetical protein
MGLFNFVSKLITAPIKASVTTVKTTAKITGNTLLLNLDGVADNIDEGTDELSQILDDINESLD